MSVDWELDFVSAHLFSPRRVTYLGILLGAIGSVSSLYIFSNYQYQYNVLENLSVQERIQTKPVDKPVIEAQRTISSAELRQIANTVNLLGISWVDLMHGIEQSMQRDVALVLIAPDASKQQIVLQGEARNMEAVLRYVEALQTLPMLHDIHLQRHQVQASDFTPIEFVIAARWNES